MRLSPTFVQAPQTAWRRVDPEISLFLTKHAGGGKLAAGDYRACSEAAADGGARLAPRSGFTAGSGGSGAWACWTDGSKYSAAMATFLFLLCACWLNNLTCIGTGGIVPPAAPGQIIAAARRACG